MTQIIDRRLNGKDKSAVNRQRFIRRFKHQIKSAVQDAISKRSITDINSGERIVIPKKDISEPQFQHGEGGHKEFVLPGNKEFVPGDRIQRPTQGGKGKGSEASNEGEGTDDFGFEISREEFLELFFEDLALPDLIKTKLHETPTYKYVRAGYATTGVPPNINITRSLRNATGRKIAFSGIYKRKMEKLEEELAILSKTLPETDPKIIALKEKLKSLHIKLNSIPFIDEFDIRYNSRVKLPQPSTAAVMFCLMDVSGSMDQTKKEIAKRFFIILYLFLTKTYENIQLVFIRHHTTAKEVDEQEFFYSRETGGTVVSSALELMKKIIQARYPTEEWNIYAAQASDGDNWNADSPLCQQLLINDIMPYLQYYAYVEIMPRHHQSLWHSYSGVKEVYKNFSMQQIDTVKDIYPVFHDLFKRKTNA